MSEILSHIHLRQLQSRLSKTPERRRILVLGIVQGVGFRPFVHRLAEQRGIAGFVRNTSRGVIVEAEGERAVLDAFCRSLREKLPPLAEIVDLEVAEIPARGDTESTVCISGEILKGIKKPPDCRAFGTLCTPQRPLGATMVSSEGACAAYYLYGRHLNRQYTVSGLDPGPNES